MNRLTASEPENAAVIWHDLECGAYAGDLPLWEQLAAELGGPVLDLGCGAGRVALYLARRGHEVVGVDSEGALIEELARRAARSGLPVRGHRGDVRGLELGRRFPLVLAPMQLVELLPDRQGRAECLSAIAAHLTTAGRAAVALVGEVVEIPDAGPPLPDVLERDGWVHSSLPLPSAVSPGQVGVRRLRQTVSPSGELEEEVSEVALYPVTPATIESEALECGLRPHGHIEIPPSDDHIGSTVVLLGRR
jgi:SAM-dependent methyltransferase